MSLDLPSANNVKSKSQIDNNAKKIIAIRVFSIETTQKNSIGYKSNNFFYLRR